MSRFDVAIIGGGLGSLETALVLSKEGMNVCVVERCHETGGLFQSFRRHGYTIDTSIHYVGSMDKGEALHRCFSYFGILDEIDYVRLNEKSFDNIYVEDSHYSYAMGLDNFEESLHHQFPSDRDAIKDYCKSVRKVGEISNIEVLKNRIFTMDYMDYVTMAASQEIKKCSQNPGFFDALWGTSLLYAGIEDITPFYIHAITLYSNLSGACRFRGGTSAVTDAMVRKIEENGGVVLKGAEVTRIMVERDSVKGLVLADGRRIESNNVISGIHPAETFRILDDNSVIKPSFISRIFNEKNSYGLFCLYLLIKPGTMRYRNENYFIRKGNNRVNYVLLSMQPPVNNPGYAEVVTIVTPVALEDFDKWNNGKHGDRSVEYIEYKESMSDELLDFVSDKFPELKGSISYKYSATPLTFKDYTATPQGSAYGIQKNYNKPFSTFIATRTKLSGLFLTGQNINVHGVLGVTISSLLTSAELLGGNYLIDKLKNI